MNTGTIQNSGGRWTIGSLRANQAAHPAGGAFTPSPSDQHPITTLPKAAHRLPPLVPCLLRSNEEVGAGGSRPTPEPSLARSGAGNLGDGTLRSIQTKQIYMPTSQPVPTGGRLTHPPPCRNPAFIQRIQRQHPNFTAGHPIASACLLADRCHTAMSGCGHTIVFEITSGAMKSAKRPGAGTNHPVAGAFAHAHSPHILHGNNWCPDNLGRLAGRYSFTIADLSPLYHGLRNYRAITPPHPLLSARTAPLLPGDLPRFPGR